MPSGCLDVGLDGLTTLTVVFQCQVATLPALIHYLGQMAVVFHFIFSFNSPPKIYDIIGSKLTEKLFHS